jgi:SagB-type dehydrogenase family enzyme
LQTRRSIRVYSGKALNLQEVSQLLWAAQGVTNSKGYRTAPSAMASFSLQTYLIAVNVQGLEAGIYRFEPSRHGLVPLQPGDFKGALTRTGMGGYFVEGGAIYIVFAANPARTRSGEAGVKYIAMEAGHAAQNVYLQATVLGLGTVVNGGFNAEYTRQVLAIPQDEEPLYWMPVGRIA